MESLNLPGSASSKRSRAWSTSSMIRFTSLSGIRCAPAGAGNASAHSTQQQESILRIGSSSFTLGRRLPRRHADSARHARANSTADARLLARERAEDRLPVVLDADDRKAVLARRLERGVVFLRV